MTAIPPVAVAALASLGNARLLAGALPVPVGVPEWMKLAGDLALKGALLLAAAFLVVAMLRRAAAAVRHLVWCCAFAGLLALPALELLLPSWRVKVVAPAASMSPAWQVRPAAFMRASVPPAGRTVDDAERGPTRAGEMSAAAGAPDGATPAAVAARPDPSAVSVASTPIRPAINMQRLIGWAGVSLVAIAFALWARLVIAHLAARLLVRRARDGGEPHWTRLLDSCRGAIGLRRTVGLRLTAERAMPLTTGVLRPVLLLPSDAADWPGDRRRVVLLHELAHVRRWDCLTQLLAQVAAALYWYNPLAWLAARRMLAEQERACDDLVLARGAARPSEYAGHLLSIAQSLAAPRGGLRLAAVGMARPSQLEGRLLAVLDNNRRRRPPGAWAKLAAMVTLAGALVPLASVRLTRADPAPATQPAGTWTDPAVARPQRLTATLPNGITIELLGVSEHLSKDKPWWSPAGAPIPDRFTSDVSSKDTPKSDDLTLTREFVIRLTGVPEDASDPRWATPGVNLTYTADEARRVDEQDPELLGWQQQLAVAKHRADAAAATKGMEAEAARERDRMADLRRKIDARREQLASKSAEREPAGSRLRAMAAAFPADTRKVNLRVGIATGPWKTVAEDPGAGPATRPVRDVMTDEERRTLTARMREIERQYEGKADRPPGVPLSPTAAKYKLDRLLQEESRIQAELAGLNARYQHITEELRAGRTPPEIEKQIETDTRYLNARQRLDDIDVELDGLIERRGDHDDLVISWKRRRQTYQQKQDEVREELKRKYAEQTAGMYKEEIDATTANIARLHAQIQSTKSELAAFEALEREDRSITERLAGRPAGSAEFGVSAERNGQATVSVLHELTDANVRIAAVDSDGREVAPRTFGTTSVGARQRTTATFELPADHIRELRLQARPYRWAEFREVALQPSDGGTASAAAAATPDTTRLAGKGRRSTTPEPDEIVQLYLAEKLQLGTSLNDARENLQRAEKELRQADADKRSYTPEDWARVDETMKTHVNMRNELQLRVDSLESQLGSAHQAVIRAKEDLAARQRYMDGYTQLLNAKFIIRWKEDGTGGALIPRDLSPLREHVARLAAQDEAMSKKVDEMQSAARAAAAGEDPVRTDRRLALLRLLSRLREARAQLDEAKWEIAAADKLSQPEDFARVDERAKDLLRRRDDRRGELDELGTKLGPDAAEVRSVRSRLERADAQWREYTADLAKRFYVHWDSSGKGPSLVPRDQSPLEARVERLAQEVEEARKQLEPGKAR